MRIDGRLGAISGGLWHANDPSIVWFWPILVLLGCVLAARRLRRPAVDTRVGRVLSVAALLAIAIGGAGQQLHGRPTVSIGQYIGLGVILAGAGWGLFWVLVRRPGYFSFLVIAVVAVWEGIQLVPTLLNGFVLTAVPAFAARTAAVACLGSAAGLLSLVTRIADRAEAASAISGDPPGDPDDDDAYGWDRSDEPWLGQACTVRRWRPRRRGADLGRPVVGMRYESRHGGEIDGIPHSLLLQARPIGSGANFRPPATGPVIGACRHRLGPRELVLHVELFFEQPGGDRGCRDRHSATAQPPAGAHIAGGLLRHPGDARADSGLVLVRAGSRPLRCIRQNLFPGVGSATVAAATGLPSPSTGMPVAVFVDGRRWHGLPGNVLADGALGDRAARSARTSRRTPPTRFRRAHDRVGVHARRSHLRRAEWAAWRSRPGRCRFRQLPSACAPTGQDR